VRNFVSHIKGEYRLRMLKRRVLKKVVGSEREKLKGDSRKLHNQKLHAFYSSPDIISDSQSKRMGWTKHVAYMGNNRTAYMNLSGNPKCTRPLEKSRCRRKDTI
jgi:hypothetical protein